MQKGRTEIPVSLSYFSLSQNWLLLFLLFLMFNNEHWCYKNIYMNNNYNKRDVNISVFDFF